MTRKINSGSGWTLIATECWARSGCAGCVYGRYCYKPKRKVNDIPVIREVISQLLEKFGEPPEKLLLALEELEQRPIII